MPNCEKIVMLGQHEKAVLGWAMQKVDDENIGNTFAFYVAWTARTDAVAHVGLSPELSDCHQ